MAIILKKESKTAVSGLFFKSSLVGKTVTVGLVVLIGGAAILAGQMMKHGDIHFKAPSESLIDVKGALLSSKKIPAFELNSQASRIWAAASAFAEANPDETLGALDELSPGFIPSEQGTPPDYLSNWRLNGNLLTHSVNKELCEQIEGSASISPIFYGKGGLSCFTFEDNYVAAYLYKDSSLLEESLWPITVKGRWSDGLTSWQVRTGAAGEESSCLVPTRLEEDGTYFENKITLDAANPDFEATLCLSSHLAEQDEIIEGLSFFNGIEAHSIAGFSQKKPWTLELLAQTCEPGVSSEGLLRFGFGEMTPTNWTSCDLKSKVVKSPAPRLVAPDVSELIGLSITPP